MEESDEETRCCAGWQQTAGAEKKKWQAEKKVEEKARECAGQARWDGQMTWMWMKWRKRKKKKEIGMCRVV